MNNANIKHLLIITGFAAILCSNTFAQQSENISPKKESKQKSCCSAMNHSMADSSKSSMKTKISAVIDLNKLDKNKDGKVYNDGMCLDVISDEPGTCSKCGMKLKEISVGKLKKKMSENGFSVK